jgi:hypothetical protein
VDVQALEYDRTSGTCAITFSTEANPLAFQVFERPDLRAGKEIRLSYEEFRDIIDALFNVSDATVLPVELECIGVGDRDIYTLKVKQIIYVLISTVAHDRQDAKVFAIIERFSELNGEANESAFEEATS